MLGGFDLVGVSVPNSGRLHIILCHASYTTTWYYHNNHIASADRVPACPFNQPSLV